MEVLKQLLRKVLGLEHVVYVVPQENDKSFSKAIIEGLVGAGEKGSLIKGVNRPSTFKLKVLVERVRSKTIGFSILGCNYDIVTQYDPKLKRLTVVGKAIGYKKIINEHSSRHKYIRTPATFSFTMVVDDKYNFQTLETDLTVNDPNERK